ncbi:MAG: hypothetical protein GWP10_15535, partial [Nitrospiraceae bacterium]|nr:hypothetical protein [Nitrospiraceae bacterium]
MNKISFISLMLACVLFIISPTLFAESNADIVSSTKTLTNSSSKIALPTLHLKNTLRGTRGVLVSQIPDTLSSTGHACQLDSVYPLDADLADDIDPTGAGWIIDSVTAWFHNWNGFTNWDSVPNIHFLVYEDSGIGTPMPKNVQSAEYVVEKANYVATEIDSANGLWRVDFTFSTPVTITGGAKSWIEIQPSNVYNANGQTGLMGDSGIGNGQEMYIRFPAAGTNDWTSATTQFGIPSEAAFVLYGSEFVGSYLCDFETGPQGWTHTNGQAFPAGWAVQLSGLHANAVSPDPGDSSMWIDSDAAGSGITIFDTCLSPVVVPPTNMAWFKWGYGYQNLSNADTLTIGYRVFSTGAWQPFVEVRRFNDDMGSALWDSVDVSSVASADSIQLYFAYLNANYAWYASFDNVSLFAPASHDVGVAAITNPPSEFAGPGNYDVTATIHNFGPVAETFDVTADVYDTTDSWNLVFTQGISLTDFPSSGDTTHTFGTVAFADSHVYFTKVYTSLTDDVPANDTLSQYTTCTTTFWEIGPNMPYTSSGPYAGYSTVGGNLCLHVFGGNPGPQSDHYIFDGTSWTSGKPLPAANNYGGYCSVNNKIYMIGGRTEGPDSLITIYDANLDTFTTRYLPGTIGDPAVAVKDNNYIYIIGGCRPSGWVASTIVMLYDIAGDSFFTSVTQLPAADARIAASAGYLGNDTLIVAGGIDTANTYTNTTLLGIVDPTNPANITWIHGPDKPGTAVYRLSGGVWNGKFYITGGAYSSYSAETYMYEPGSGWTTLPDKPTACSNFGGVMVPLPTTKDNEGILTTAGGYTG